MRLLTPKTTSVRAKAHFTGQPRLSVRYFGALIGRTGRTLVAAKHTFSKPFIRSRLGRVLRSSSYPDSEH